MAADVRQVEAGTFEPVTLERARLHLRLDATGTPPRHPEDALVEAFVRAAREQAEEFTSRLLTDAVYELRLEAFEPVIELPRAPVSQVASIRYLDDAGVLQTVPAGTAELDAHPEHPVVRLLPSQQWPVVARGPGAVRIRFTGGYDSPDVEGTNPMPSSISAAMLLIIGHLYLNREQVRASPAVEVPMGAQYLMWPYRLNLGV